MTEMPKVSQGLGRTAHNMTYRTLFKFSILVRLP